MGIPVMLAEFAVGRGSRSDTVSAFQKLTPRKPWWIIGVLGVLAPYLILMYYMVVAGWTLEYFWMSLTGELFDGLQTATSETAFFSNIMSDSLERMASNPMDSHHDFHKSFSSSSMALKRE